MFDPGSFSRTQADGIYARGLLSDAEIMSKPNVIGYGVGVRRAGEEWTDQMVLTVLVERKVRLDALRAEDVIPGEIRDAPTDVLEVGKLVAQQNRKTRWRPAPPGVSIGHINVTAGTLGAVVMDKLSGEMVILSNNHVLANTNAANLGDPIIQPGAYDGGRMPEDEIGYLLRYEPILTGEAESDCTFADAVSAIGNIIARLIGSEHRLVARKQTPAENLIDAALAMPNDATDIVGGILGINAWSGQEKAVLGLPVQKSGRTTGHTHGSVVVINATVNVNYGEDRIVKFVDQIVTTAMSAGGDSGSLVLTYDGISALQRAVGLLFAGSDRATIINPIAHVVRLMEIELP